MIGLAAAWLSLVAGLSPASADLAGVAVLATNSVQIKTGTEVTGDVVANEASAGPTLEGTRELVIERFASVDGDAAGDSVWIKRDATVTGTVSYNDLLNDGTVGALSTPLALPVIADVPPFQLAAPRPDAPDVFVGAGEVLSLEAGDYGAITIAQTGTLLLEGGLYNALSVAPVTTSGGQCPYPCRSILFDGPVDVRILERLDVGKDSQIGPAPSSGLTAADAVLYVAGTNGGDGTPNALPSAAMIGQGSTLDGTLYAANGTVRIDKSSTVVGSLLGRDALIDRDSTVEAEAFFIDFPPTADEQVVYTDGTTPLEIILTGSDPEGGDLIFSIVTNPTEGTLGPVTPIVPDPVGRCSISTGTACAMDGDCPAGETCVLTTPAVTSASVVYTAAAATNLEDSFEFAVTDVAGATDTATVSINPPDDPGGGGDPEVVEVDDAAVETAVDTPVTVVLGGDAPATVPITFSIVGGPANGTLGAVVQGIEVPQRTATVEYTPASGFSGTDSFTFQAAGDLNDDGDTLDPGETAVGTASIGVADPAPPVPPTAENVVTSTPAGTPITIGLSGTPGTGGGTQPLPARSAFTSGSNGARSGSEGQVVEGSVPITVGAGWTATSVVPPAFFWGGPGPVFSTDGPFTFAGAACVSVTDDFDKGDRFTVYDDGQPIGTTPQVPVVTTGTEVGPDAAYFDSTYSSGSFEVADASVHSITIEIVENPFGGGRGYIRVDPLGSAFCAGECGLVFAVVTGPSNGTVSVIDPMSSTSAEIVYTPDEGFSGVDSFTYSVTDCFGAVAFGTVTVTVTDSTPCNDCETLTVELFGSAEGTVTSNPLIVDSNSGQVLGILCPGLCVTDFEAGSGVVLQARPDGTAVFAGWGGDCAGSSPIVVVSMTEARTCTATFSAAN